jgi:hypothetical protein
MNFLRKKRKCPSVRQESGQALIEFVIAAAMFSGVLFFLQSDREFKKPYRKQLEKIPLEVRQCFPLLSMEHAENDSHKQPLATDEGNTPCGS